MKTITRRSVLMGGAAGLATATGASGGDYRGYETPEWRVLKVDGAFELREYAPYLAAEVTIRGAPDAALRQGFRTLAGYIFGANDGGSKVAMTAPVTRAPEKIAMTAPVTRQATGDAWTVRFMMPRGESMATLPKPDNPAVRLVTVDPGRRAVHRFTGLATEARLARAERDLRGWMARVGLEAVGPPEAAWFDDPFTLPWRRRNEVSLPVAMT